MEMTEFNAQYQVVRNKIMEILSKVDLGEHGQISEHTFGAEIHYRGEILELILYYCNIPFAGIDRVEVHFGVSKTHCIALSDPEAFTMILKIAKSWMKSMRRHDGE